VAHRARTLLTPLQVLPLAGLLVACAGDGGGLEGEDEAPPADYAIEREEGPPAAAEEAEGDEPAPQRVLVRDRTQGPVATFVYVTEWRNPRTDAVEPSAWTYTSDPQHVLYGRMSRPRFPVNRLTRRGMGDLLEHLERRGLAGVSWDVQPYDEDIGPQRAFYLYRDGGCRVVFKADLSVEQQKTFTRVERALAELPEFEALLIPSAARGER